MPDASRLTGYAHPEYAASLAEFGRPLALPRSGGWLLRRRIPNASAHDAMGCYPLFACADWSALPADLKELADELVSVVLVADVFGAYTPEQLQTSFEVVRPFKQHFIVDCAVAVERATSAHHRYYARKALRHLHVELCEEPGACLDDWCALYSNLVERRGITGIRAFSGTAFARQLGVPGARLFRAVLDGVTIGAQWYYIQGDVAYSHLTAISAQGYRMRAAYALQASSLDYMRQQVRWVDLGGGAGLADRNDGLTEFKRGWSTGTRPAYLCGRILNPTLYDEAVRSVAARSDSYFPAYRHDDLV